MWNWSGESHQTPFEKHSIFRHDEPRDTIYMLYTEILNYLGLPVHSAAKWDLVTWDPFNRRCELTGSLSLRTHLFVYFKDPPTHTQRLRLLLESWLPSTEPWLKSRKVPHTNRSAGPVCGELIVSCQQFRWQAFIYQVVVFPWTWQSCSRCEGQQESHIFNQRPRS